MPVKQPAKVNKVEKMNNLSKIPGSPGSPRKRLAGINTSAFKDEPTAKKMSTGEINGLFPVQTTSFMQYRSFIPATSDTEVDTETETSDSSIDDDSETQSSSDEDGDGRYSRRGNGKWKENHYYERLMYRRLEF